MADIDASLADAIYDILVSEAGARDTPDSRFSFVQAVASSVPPTREYRFVGSLGFGGKVRLDPGHDRTPYVDCYPEDRNPRREAAIGRCNAAISALFRPLPHAAPR